MNDEYEVCKQALQDRLDFAVQAASASSQLTLAYFGRSDIDQSTKEDGTPVTIADRACELDLRTRIETAYPMDSILGEEFPSKTGTSAYEWVIDPIDGTISFVQGVPLFGTMLACMKDGHPVLGVIVMPALDEMVYAADGLGCWHVQGEQEPKRTQVSSESRLDRCLLNTTSLSYFTTDAHRALYDQLDRLCLHTRGWSDCYAWVLLATGRVDAVIEPVLSLWDFTAAIPIVSEAGGRWCDFAGHTQLESGQIIAANPALLDDLLGIVRGHGDS